MRMLKVPKLISTAERYFSMILKQIDDVTRREMPRLHISATHTSIFNKSGCVSAIEACSMAFNLH